MPPTRPVRIPADILLVVEQIAEMERHDLGDMCAVLIEEALKARGVRYLRAKTEPKRKT